MVWVFLPWGWGMWGLGTQNKQNTVGTGHPTSVYGYPAELQQSYQLGPSVC